MTYAPAPSTQPTRQHEISWRYVSVIHPITKRYQAHPRNTSPNDSQVSWQFRHPLFPFIIVKPPIGGSGTFLPGGRPPVNVSCKGGRSPQRTRSQPLRRLAHGYGECQARCLLAEGLCISVITQICSWNWPTRRAHFTWMGNETAVARAVCDPVQRGLDEFHDAK